MKRTDTRSQDLSHISPVKSMPLLVGSCQWLWFKPGWVYKQLVWRAWLSSGISQLTSIADSARFPPPCASWVNYERPLWAHACSINNLFTEPSWGQYSLHGYSVKSLNLLQLRTLNLHRHEQEDMQMQAPFSVIVVKSLLTYFLYKKRCCCGGSC